jgi:hypothetical protein
MAFVLKGEIELDGRKATTGLRAVQKEATKTASTFKQSDASAQKLGKTLVSLGLNASKAGTSLGMLARLGTGGIFGYAVIGAMNKFGETVKQASTDYYSAQKDLADAFETSFKSTSVDQARAGLEKTQDTIESLRGKITQLGPMAGIMKGIEKVFNLDLGVSSTEKTLKDTQALLDAEMQLLATRQQEEKITKQGKEEAENTERTVKQNKILRQLNAVRNKTQADFVTDAKAELELAKYQLSLINQQIEQLYELKDVGVNIKLIDDLTRKGREKDLEVAQKRLSLEQASQKQKADVAKVASAAGGGTLGASRAGGQALDVARKLRERQLKTENFKTAEKIAPTQRDREKLAAQQAAGEMPSLAEKIRGGLTGVDPSQLARESAATKFEKDRSVGKGTLGSPPIGELGKEQSSLGKETLQAIKALVDLMKSGPLVN